MGAGPTDTNGGLACLRGTQAAAAEARLGQVQWLQRTDINCRRWATCQHLGLALATFIHEGHVGMVHAATKFDPEHGVRLVTYAF